MLFMYWVPFNLSFAGKYCGSGTRDVYHGSESAGGAGDGRNCCMSASMKDPS
jgi:hypothetical protein